MELRGWHGQTCLSMPIFPVVIMDAGPGHMTNPWESKDDE